MTIIYQKYYQGPRMQGRRESEFLDRINGVFIYFVACAIRHCLKLWKTGELKQGAPISITDMSYRAAPLQRFKRLVEFKCQLLLLTATLPLTEEPQFVNTMGLTSEMRLQTMRCATGWPNLHCRVLGIPRAVGRNCDILGPPLMNLLRERAILALGERGIILCLFVHDLEVYQSMIHRNGALCYQPQIYHSKLGESLRSNTLAKWLDIGGWILATKGLGVGIDVPKLRMVIHMSFGQQDTLMEYSQQVGRAAWDGISGFCYCLHVHEDPESMSTALTPGSEALSNYLYATACRRQTLGAYLDSEAAICGAGDSPCDFCDDTLSWGLTPP